MKKYGRILETVTDKTGRKINLYLNSYNHIMKLHDKQEIWVKHWERIIKNITPDKKGNTLHYTDIIDGYNFQIRVVKEKRVFLIKTAIISRGKITSFRRIRNV